MNACSRPGTEEQMLSALSVRHGLFEDFLHTIILLIDQRAEQIEWFKNLDEILKKQNIYVNSVKTLSAVSSIASFGLLFTPLAPAGLLGAAICAGGTSLTSYGNVLLNRSHRSKMENCLQRYKETEVKLEALARELKGYVEYIMEVFNLNACDALLIAFGLSEQLSIVLALNWIKQKLDENLMNTSAIFRLLHTFGLDTATVRVATECFMEFINVMGSSVQSLSVYMNLGQNMIGLSTIVGVGATVTDGVGVVSATSRLGASNRLGATSRLGRCAVSGGARVFNGLGMSICVIDCIYSWIHGNPCQKTATEILQKIEESSCSLSNELERLNAVKNGMSF